MIRRALGNRCVGADGGTMVLRGVSLSDPDRLEKAGHWDRRYFEAARSWGANVVRFPIHPRAWREMATELGFMQPGDRGAHVPVLGDVTYGRAMVDYFTRRGISWTAWVFDPDRSPQLLTGWDFRPTRQGVFFRDALRRLNAPPPAR